MSAHQDALDKAKIQLMMKPDSVFFASVCFSLTHVWDESIPTACTNGIQIRYSPQFFMSLTPAEQLFLLLHETLHVAFQHNERRGERDPRKWNVACDYAINFILVQAGFRMPSGGLYDRQYEGMSADQIYEMLPDSVTQNLPMDDLEPSNEPQSEDEKTILRQQVDEILIRASLQSQMAGNDPGSIPGELQVYIDSLTNPIVPWDRLLEKYVTRNIRRGYTLKKPNRRFFPDHYLPSRNSKAVADIAVAMDLSGSVEDAEITQCFTDTHHLLVRQKPTSLKLLQFDTDIRAVNDLHSVNDLMRVNFTGRGGTRIEPVIEWAAKHKPTVMVIFTDGFFKQRYQNPGVPVIWLIFNNPGFQPKYGKAIHYTVDT